MIDYELGKKLEESGYVGMFDLKSLIEACGYDNFISLETLGANSWCATAKNDPLELVSGIGSTPEIAVVNLWLALNT